MAHKSATARGLRLASFIRRMSGFILSYLQSLHWDALPTTTSKTTAVHNFEKKKMANKLLFVIFLPSLCLVSCGSNPNPESEPELSLLAAECTEAPIYPTPSSPKRAVYILLDNSGSYANYYAVASQRLQEVLIQTLRPGDFVGIGLIGQNAADVILPNTVFPSPQEPITPNPTLTPLPGDALPFDLQQHELENAPIERAGEEYNCVVEDWNKAYNVSAPQRGDLPIFKDISNAIPVQSQAEESTDIQSALFNAHDFFSQARVQGYTNLKLIILSDMVANVPPGEFVESIDLSGVSVVTAMVPLIKPDEFIELQTSWADWFGVYRVTAFQLLTEPNSTPPIFVSYLES